MEWLIESAPFTDKRDSGGGGGSKGGGGDDGRRTSEDSLEDFDFGGRGGGSLTNNTSEPTSLTKKSIRNPIFSFFFSVASRIILSVVLPFCGGVP